MKTKLYKYQKKGVHLIEKFKGRALLADEMGLGKTLQSLWWARRNDSWPIIVVCPAHLKYNWEREAAAHVQMRVNIIEGTKVPSYSLPVKHKIIVINYDILDYWVDYLRGLKPKVVVMDEVHFISNPNTIRSMACKDLCKGVKHVIGISGTPLTNTPADLYAALSLINPKLFKSYFTFAMRYSYYRSNRGKGTFSGGQNLHELHEILLKKVMIRRRKKDVLKDLPDKTRCIIPMEIENPEEYAEADLDIIKWLSKTSIDKARKAKRAKELARMTHLKKLAATLKLNSVFKWVDNFLIENSGKLVLFAHHKKIIKALQERYSKICVVVNGNVKAKDRDVAVNKFQKDSGTRLFIGNLKSAGTGLTLTAASSCAIIEFPWTSNTVTQAEDRIHRIGQLNAAMIYFLVAIGTIEEKLCELIRKKQEILDNTLDGHKVEDFNIFNELKKRMTTT